MKPENREVGDTAALKACAKFHDTLNSKRHFFPTSPQGIEGFSSVEEESLAPAPLMEEGKHPKYTSRFKVKMCTEPSCVPILRLAKGSHSDEVRSSR